MLARPTVLPHGPFAGQAANSEDEKVPSPPRQWSSPPAMDLTEETRYQARLRTSEGEVVVDLLRDDAPQTVNNFIFLARESFYDGVPFHRVMSGFMIQTGDPTGTGSGGPGYRFKDEMITRDYQRGAVAMANSGPHTNGSQFFICHADLRDKLPKNYTIFGHVSEGMDVIDRIASAPVRRSRSGEASEPVKPATIQSVEITETGA